MGESQVLAVAIAVMAPVAAAEDTDSRQRTRERCKHIDHGGGVVTAYAHQSRIAAGDGQQVSQGQVIGYVGTTGSSTGNHLHFEVRVGGSPRNPRNYLP